MAWDNEAHPAITLARLKVMPPQTVYAELRDYGDYMRSDVLSWPDAALEDALLARDEPLINIGLAKYGGSEAVANTLYQRALAGSSDPHYDKGLRLACLSNQVGSRALLKQCFGKVNLAELRRLAHDGDWADISVLLRNPSARGALDLLYNRRPPFADIPDDRLCDLVRASIHNPRLNFDESNEHGPDLTAWDIQKGVYKMLQTAPVESEWLLVLYDLLRRIDPYVARMPNSDPQQVLARWRGLKLKDRSGNDDKHDEGLFTSLSLVDEFRCMIAALYGKQYEDKTIKQLGGPDDPDVVLRCAYYGNGHLTRDRMKAAYKRDERTFVFAALLNDSFYQWQDCRVEIEEHLSDPLSYMYKARCAQIHTRYPPFDPRPVSDTVTQEKPPTAEMAALSRIGDQIAAVQAQIGRMSSITILGFIALLAILLYTQY